MGVAREGAQPREDRLEAPGERLQPIRNGVALRRPTRLASPLDRSERFFEEGRSFCEKSERFFDASVPFFATTHHFVDASPHFFVASTHFFVATDRFFARVLRLSAK